MRSEAAIMTHTRRRGVGRLLLLRRDELHVVQTEMESFNRFLDQIRILLADVPELHGGNAHEQLAVFHVAVASGLQPGVVGVAVNFFLERLENLHPGIDGSCGSG